ncbi:MAG: hypothetical protein LBB89_02100 [Treponema sp.]|nr:hypothetical protein [Treponema sp.]
MTLEQIVEIKKQTRLALPADDTYLYRLGVALYGFASINSFMTEIICHIDKSQDRISLLDKTSGPILCKFRETLDKIKDEEQYPEIYEVMSRTADLFGKLNNQRNDIAHPYPITNDKNEQILHRRKDSTGKYFEVDNTFLDRFISELHDVSSGLYEIRKVVRPDL